MTTERNNLLVSIATTTADYREGELETPTPEHVDRWINQFDPSVQMPMLRELEHVLKKTYLSKKHMVAFLGKLARWEDLTGGNSGEFWHMTNFLRIQQGRNSQIKWSCLHFLIRSLKLNTGIERRTVAGLETPLFTLMI